MDAGRVRAFGKSDSSLASVIDGNDSTCTSGTGTAAGPVGDGTGVVGPATGAARTPSPELEQPPRTTVRPMTTDNAIKSRLCAPTDGDPTFQYKPLSPGMREIAVVRPDRREAITRAPFGSAAQAPSPGRELELRFPAARPTEKESVWKKETC